MVRSTRRTRRISAFDFAPGTVLADKYEVLRGLGAGWEGEVYLVRERGTGIDRAAKLFFPQRNPHDRTARFYARKLHKLRQCPIIIQYHASESVRFGDCNITCLLSDFVEGEPLDAFVKRQSGRRLAPFQAVHLLHALANGIECIHASGDYHGDLHAANIIVQRAGLGFELKLLDMFHWGRSTRAAIADDVVELVRIFYESLGGQRHYARLPPEIKAICRGLKRSLILRRFRTAGELRGYLETMEWS
jgi:tRNA A-37 threonylcarbamoyl transferase component Bud32